MNCEIDIKQAVECLRKGGVILYPTDTVWGLGCDATNETAVKRIFEIKKRQDAKAMLCLVDKADRIQRYFRNIPDVAWDIFDSADSPVSIILDGAEGVAPSLISEDGSLGIRVTREQFSHDICYRLQHPLVSTSANISGEPTARTFREISEGIKSQVDYICSFRRGDNIPGSPSRIIKLGIDSSVKIIR